MLGTTNTVLNQTQKENALKVSIITALLDKCILDNINIDEVRDRLCYIGFKLNSDYCEVNKEVFYTIKINNWVIRLFQEKNNSFSYQ